ncbi:MAG: tetratricopeptide repeat protein [Vulcanimicrobiota bacterium]
MKEEASLTLTVGKKLLHLTSLSEIGRKCRKRLSQLHSLAIMELGYLPPFTDIIHSGAVDDYSYTVSVNSNRVHLGYIPHEGSLILGDYPDFTDIPGEELFEPLTGLPCKIHRADDLSREIAPLYVYEGLDLICLAVYQVLTRCAYHLFDEKAYRAWMDHPAVSAIKKRISSKEEILCSILRELLRMRLSIFPSPDLLRALEEELNVEHADIPGYSEAVRKKLISSRGVPIQFDNCGAFHLTEEVKSRLRSLQKQKESMTTKMLEEEGREILQALSSFVYPLIRERKNPAVITPPEVRHFMERLSMQIYPELSVIASDEIDCKVIPFIDRKTTETGDISHDPSSIDTHRWFKGRYSHFLSECLKNPVFYKVAPLRDELERRALACGSYLISEERQKGEMLLQESITRNPSSFPALHILGEHCLLRDSIPQARQLMQEAMSRHAGYSGFLVERARKLFTEGEQRLPQQLLLASLDLNPANYQAYCLLGEMHSLEGNYYAAEKAVNKSIEIFSGDPGAWRLKGRLQLEQEQFNEAQDSFLKALSLDSDDSLSRYGLAMTYYHRGKGHEAELELYRVLRIDNTMDRAYYRLGCIYLITGRFELAEEHFQKALSLDCNNAEYHASLGILCAEQDDYKKAIKYLNKALNIMPTHPGWLSLCARLYQESGENEEALQLYDRMILLSHDESASHHAKGLLLLEMGREHEGIAALSDSIRCNPHNIDAYEALGWAFLSKGELRKAEKIFLKGLSLESNVTTLLYGIGNVYLHSDRLEEALKTAEKLLSLDSSSVEGQLLLGRISARKGNRKKALSYLKHALSVKQSDEVLHCEVASLTLELGNIREAMEMMENLRDGAAPCSDVLLILGRACRKADRIDDARREWTEGLSRFPQISAFYLELFLLYDECSEFERMRALAQSIEKHIPEDITGRGIMALIALSFYELDSAEEKFHALLREKRVSWISHSYLALIAFLKHEYRNAERKVATAHKERGEKIYRDSFLGELSLLTGREELYEEQCTAFLRSHKDDLQVKKSLGAFYLKKGELSRAFTLLMQCKRKNPRLSGLFALLSELYFRQGKLKKAEDILLEGLRLSPKNPELYMKLGKLAFLKGNRPAGERAMRQALAYAPPKPCLLYSLTFQLELGNWNEVRTLYAQLDQYLREGYDASLCNALALMEEGYFQETLSVCAQLSRHCGDRYLHAELLYLESAIFWLTGKTTKMLEKLKKAADKAVDVGNAMLAVPFLLYFQGDLSQARACILDALKKRPAFAEAFFLLGLIEQKEGNKAGARKSYERALRLNPHHRRYKEQIKGLDKE